MTDFRAAIDEAGANVVVPAAVATLPPQAASGASSLGPFAASYSASATFTSGTVDIIPPPADVIRINGTRMNYTLSLTLSLDLSFLNFCLPRVCIPTPWGRICTPRICITFPTVSVPVSTSSFVDFTADFRLATRFVGGDWLVDLVVVGVPSLTLGAGAVALLAAIGAAASLALLAVPFIGPLLAGAVAFIVAAIGIAGITGLLGAILTPFVSGLTFTVFRQPQLLTVVPADASGAAVNVTLDTLAAVLDGSGGEDELVISADVSP